MSSNIESLAVLNVVIPLAIILIGNAVARLPVRQGWRGQQRPNRWFEALTLAGSLVCLFLSIALVINAPDETLTFTFLGIDILLDALSVYFIFLVNIVATFAAWNAFTSPPDLIVGGARPESTRSAAR